MKHKIKYWLSGKRRQMAKLGDLQRQLTEAWRDLKDMREARDAARAVSLELAEQKHYVTEQLRRVSRERFEERELRLAAEELRDVYLEQLENEEE